MPNRYSGGAMLIEWHFALAIQLEEMNCLFSSYLIGFPWYYFSKSFLLLH